MSSQNQRERTDFTGESVNHFREHLRMLWPQNVEEMLVRKVLPQFLLESLAWSLTPQGLPPPCDATTKVCLPFLSPFLFLSGS